MTTLAPERTQRSTDRDHVCHLLCDECYPDGRGSALCGATEPDGWCSHAGPADCVVCRDLEDSPCPRCGS